MEEKYIFDEYRSSEYQVDPVFKTKGFRLFGNVSGLSDNPDLFHVNYKSWDYRYCLINPKTVVNNDELLLKIKRYLIVHENDSTEDSLNTYFIGDLNKSLDVSSEFTNQTTVPVTYAMVEQWYPKKLKDIFKIVINYCVKKQKHPGELIHLYSIDEDVLFVDPNLSDIDKRDYKFFITRCMHEEGLITKLNTEPFFIDLFTLTAKAISLIEDEKSQDNKVAFIAIKFGDNQERIAAIQNAIAQAGFEPRIMNQLETNNWIMPEIFYQIKNSRFVVADFSLPCDGAYYEAGYAAALEKPVIHLFDSRELREDNKLHFDIAQKSTIFYENYDDLKKRLYNRIRATIK